ncbi:MAG: DUF6273 domain-containing protein [Oscillospiraceae bacterium]|nr:DUF6273 domain-containing protein [Oscillospiraceae bacterium]
MNGEFYNSFSANDRERISETRVATPDNSWYDTSGGEIVGNKIFLLSIEEVARYFGDSGALARGSGEMKGEHDSNGKPVYTYTDGDGNDAIYYNYERHWIDDQYNDVRIGKTNTDENEFVYVTP